jgi:hypothetical protein
LIAEAASRQGIPAFDLQDIQKRYRRLVTLTAS